MTRVQCTGYESRMGLPVPPTWTVCMRELVISRPIRGSQVADRTQSGPGLATNQALAARLAHESRACDVCGSSSHMMMGSFYFRVLFSENLF